MSASLCWIAWNSAIALAELLPLERVLARDVVRGLRDPDRLRGDPDPAAVERRHRDREALALLVQQPVAADAAPSTTMSLVADELRPSFSSSRVTRTCVGVEDEGARRRARRACRDRCARRAGTCRRSRAVVINCFAPVIRQPSPFGVGRGAQRAGVRARLRLGQRERADLLAARERRHEARPLLVGAEARGSAA